MTLWGICLLFFKFGLLSFGGGYVLIPMIQESLVESNLLSAAEFAEIISIAQMTPGPVGMNTATFVGYKIGGIPGGILATLSLIAGPSILVVLAVHYLNKWSQTAVVRGLLAGIRPASLGLIVMATVIFANLAFFPEPITFIQLRDSISGGGKLTWNYGAVALAVIAYLAMTYTKINIFYLIIGAGVLGMIIC